jgi:NAD(P)-dependent dehydrogenase (short-subunit alcohol dehydrogenase family)
MDATSNDGRFAGTTAIVTGAGSGIGRATASRLAREGARVIATDVIGPQLDELAASLSGLEVVTVVGDVSVQADVDRVVAAAGGRVDALANIAGIMDGFLPTAELDDDTW